MFCAKCGSQIADNAKFCSACGAVNENAQPAVAPNPAQQAAPAQPHIPSPAPQKATDKKVGIIAAAVLAVIVVVLAVIIFGGRGPKAAAKQYLKGTFNGNAKQVVATLPKKLVKATIEDEYHGDKADFIEAIDDELDYMLDILDESDAKYKYKIVDVDKCDRDDTKDYEDDLNASYDTEIKVKKAKIITVELTIRYPEFDEKEKEEFEIVVGKIGPSWYVVNSDI